MPADVAERFWSKVEKDSPEGCWEWTAASSSESYGRFWLGGRLVSSHRFAYELTVGPIPAGLEIDHLCRNPACVNPAHLEPVTPRENQLRGFGVSGIAAAKTHCPAGHPYDEANTYICSKGKRMCRACARSRAAARRRLARAEREGGEA